MMSLIIWSTSNLTFNCECATASSNCCNIRFVKSLIQLCFQVCSKELNVKSMKRHLEEVHKRILPDASIRFKCH